MKIKNKKLAYKYLYSGVALLVFVTILIFWFNTQPKIPNMTPDMESCINQTKAIHGSGYRPEMVSISFKENITTEEALSLVKSYGLNIISSKKMDFKTSYSQVFVYVNVSKGWEDAWICEFKKSEIVEFADVSFIQHLT